MLGFAEELEFLATLAEGEFAGNGLPGKGEVLVAYERAGRAVCDFYIERAAAADGVCYWDTGRRGWRMGDYLSRAAEPFNEWEPVDSSAR